METAKIDLLRRAMQAYAWRSQAVSANLANLDVPGYQRVSVDFEESLREALHSGNESRMKAAEATVTIEEDAPVLEDELMELADTQMRTQLAARALRGTFDAIRTGITGRTG